MVINDLPYWKLKHQKIPYKQIPDQEEITSVASNSLRIVLFK